MAFNAVQARRFALIRDLTNNYSEVVALAGEYSEGQSVRAVERFQAENGGHGVSWQYFEGSFIDALIQSAHI